MMNRPTIVQLKHIPREEGLTCQIYAKLGYHKIDYIPTGSRATLAENRFIRSSAPEQVRDVEAPRIDISQCLELDHSCKVDKPLRHLMASRIARTEGLDVGPACGAVLCTALAAIRAAGLDQDPGAKIIVNFCNPTSPEKASTYHDPFGFLGESLADPKKMEDMVWWWEMPVATLHMKNVVTFNQMTDTLATVATVLKTCNNSQGFVLSETNEMVGVVDMDILKYKYADEEWEKHTLSGNYITSFAKLPFDSKLSAVAALLKKVTYVIFTKDVEILEEGPSGQKTEQILGIITFSDFARHLYQIEKHHLDNYGITLTDGVPCSKWFQSNCKVDLWSENLSSPAINVPHFDNDNAMQEVLGPKF